jgi:hypothetical protein
MDEELHLLKVHAILEGPYHTHDVVDDEGMYEGMDTYFCLAKVEVDGEVSDEELHFETFPEFYDMKAWLDKHIEPYEIEMIMGEFKEKYEG